MSLLLSFALSAFAAQSKTYTVGNHKIAVAVTALTPAVVVDAKSTSTQPAVQTYLVYQRLLAQGQIEGASKLTTNPSANMKTQTAYMQRVGGSQAYQKMLAQLMKEHLTVTQIVQDGSAQMLIGNHPQAGTFANFFDCSSGKCLMTDDLDHGALKDLADLFGMIREGKAKL